MKIWLDDEREPPSSEWTWVGTPQDVIELLEKNEVDEISLDHDLGDGANGTGYDVLVTIEEWVATKEYVPPRIRIHTANPAARKRMEAAVNQILTIQIQRSVLSGGVQFEPPPEDEEVDMLTHEFKEDFSRRILKIEWDDILYISRASSVFDFRVDGSRKQLLKEIKSAYGVDCTNIQDLNVWAVMRRCVAH